MLAEKYGWTIEYIMNLTRKQIRQLSEGNNEIADLYEEIKENKVNKNHGTTDAKSFFNRKKLSQRKTNNEKTNNSFYQLFSIPGIKMTDKARKKFLESKKRENDAK